jgi:NAD(P)-dependent dehydrogenase (short-subunit alcohol dehydrogenase family)
MKGKVVVITGATSGIGAIAAERLAGMGARIVMVARDKARGEAMLTRLARLGPGVDHRLHVADLSVIGETKRVGAEIAAAEPRIDVLVNNAGALFNNRETTADGLERTFATNHMSYFVLTEALKDRLVASAPARIVSTASDAHRGARLDLDDLQSTRGYSGFRVYSNSKLLNILWTRELARRLAGTGVTANCLHPGFVATRFGDQSGGLLQRLMPVAKLFAITPEKGAETIVHLASAPNIETTGGYWYKCHRATPTNAAQDDAAARRLWDESERIASLVPA